MDGEDIAWALVGGAIVWFLLKKPCPCESKPASIAVGEPSPSSSGGGCVGGLPTCLG